MSQPLVFEPHRAGSLAQVVESHARFLNERFLFSFLDLFERHIAPIRS